MKHRRIACQKVAKSGVPQWFTWTWPQRKPQLRTALERVGPIRAKLDVSLSGLLHDNEAFPSGQERIPPPKLKNIIRPGGKHRRARSHLYRTVTNTLKTYLSPLY